MTDHTKKLIDYYIPPQDHERGTFVGRAFVPGSSGGPAVVLVRQNDVLDITRHVATTSALFDHPDPVGFLNGLPGSESLGSLDALLHNSDAAVRDNGKPWLLAPIDLQAIKAAGVTFATSMVERVVEEQAKGDPSAAAGVRATLAAEIGVDLATIKPGSSDADRLKEALSKRGLWSQYLEVGLGPDAEIFTKAQPLSAVGYGADIGIHPKSEWNNPEPEIVLVVSSAGRIVGATLGNDVNLRDFEGRSALLLSKAKDNNASTAIGPLVRLFDSGFTLADASRAEVQLRVEGADDGFALDGTSSMSRISRTPADLVGQTIGGTHQYPDGFVLFLGTMFAPTKPRDGGTGFTHKIGDVVAIRSDRLGTLVNRVAHSDQAPPWQFGTRALIANLVRRGLIGAAFAPDDGRAT